MDAGGAADGGGVVDRPEHLAAGRDGAGATGAAAAGRTWPRFIALCRAVSGCSPKVDSISFSVEVCSNGPR